MAYIPGNLYVTSVGSNFSYITIYWDTNSRYYLGVSYEEFQNTIAKETSQVLSDFNQAVRLDPNNAAAYRERGLGYLLRIFGGQSEGDIIADYNQAIRLNPNDAIVYFLRGNLYSDGGDDDGKVRMDLTQAILLDPNLAIAYYERAIGCYLYEDHDDDKAFADLDQSIRLDPDFALAYFDRGKLYYRQGNLDKAIADFSKVIWCLTTTGEDDHWSLYRIYFHRGNAYEKKGIKPMPGRIIPSH
jgi:tetratricopeptide (TPR) repeat protein